MYLELRQIAMIYLNRFESSIVQYPKRTYYNSNTENLVDGKLCMADYNPNNVNKTGKKKVIHSPLSLFSHKIGVGGTLGLQEYMVTVNSGQEDELEVWGYRVHAVKYLVTVASILLTFGLLGLPLYWWKHWWLRFTRVQCVLEQATSVLVVVSKTQLTYTDTDSIILRITTREFTQPIM